MKTAEQLRVFKDTYELLVIIHTQTKNVPREYKYTLLESLKSDLKELSIIIYRTTLYQQSKLEQINLAQEYLARVIIQSRVLYDLRAFSNRFNAQIISTTQNIGQQLRAWSKYTMDMQAKELQKLNST